ncbi:MAG: hypothetical protein HY812_12550 [Planctomycetes bacterium]|nr:hypothetical protein [Planctomycetota bacterium]
MIPFFLSKALLAAAFVLPVQQAATSPLTVLDGEQIKVQFDEVEGTPLCDFIFLCQEITGVQLTYSHAEILDVRLRLIGARTLPRQKFWTYFQSVLKAHGFLLVPYGEAQPGAPLSGPGAGFYAVRALAPPMGRPDCPWRGQAPFVPAAQLESMKDDCAIVVTTTFQLEHADTPGAGERVFNMLQAYFMQPATESVRAGGENTLVVTGCADMLWRMSRLIEALNSAPGAEESCVETIELRHAAAGEIRPIVARLAGAEGASGPGPVPQQGFLPRAAGVVEADERANALIALGPREFVERVRGLVAFLDVEVEGEPTETRVVPAKNAAAEEIADVLRDWIKRAASTKGANVIPDARTNSLIVSARPKDLAELIELVEKLDVPVQKVDESAAPPERN